MNTTHAAASLVAIAIVSACSEVEPPPHTVSEFIENSILLEATIVRCARDRSKLRYEAECVNAREAANRLAAIAEEERRKGLAAESERKRRELRRSQDAAEAARRRAAEEQRRREDAEYLGIYEQLPADDSARAVSPDSASADQNGALPGNAAGVIIESPTPEPAGSPATGVVEDLREEPRSSQEERGRY